MLNRNLYAKDPARFALMNNGVSKLTEDFSDAGNRVLRYELETFVCDGKYAKGLATILDGFLINLDRRAEQPGVWISGFYGSGKSHLAKMLRVLWTDHTFDDGATARGLVPALPDAVKDHLIELAKRAKQHGGLHAAAGQLGAGAKDYVRVALLELIFKSAGLPGPIHQSRFLLWLRQQGLETAVRAHLQDVGKTLEAELPNLYVSPPLGDAVVAAFPGFAATSADARLLFKSQFPQPTDVTNDELTSYVEAALSRDGKFPLTLVVLDEVQQYIGDDAARAYQVQEAVETLCKRFSGQLLFVGTGQSALSDTPSLQRLMGRFPTKVMLDDSDVENVTRQIILRKKPSVEPTLKQTLDRHLGEISQHLRSTKLGHQVDDEKLLTADYPILPVRRRLWERLLRTIDITGTTAQLRNQLAVVHKAVLETADQPVGTVVAVDYLYDQNAAALVASAQLPRETYEQIQRFEAEGGVSTLKARLLKLVYMLGKLSADACRELGLRVTADALADMLVSNLAEGSSALRAQIPGVLKELQEADGLLLALPGDSGIEWRLQTSESREWQEGYRSEESLFANNVQLCEQLRSDALRQRLKATLDKVKPKQGVANEVRPLNLVFADSLPKDHAVYLTVWVQDGWQTQEKSVIAVANAQSPDCATLFVYVPDDHRTELQQALVAREAASKTLTHKGSPNTAEGQDARRSMEQRKLEAENKITALLAAIEQGARVFQAGGNEVTDGKDLAAKVENAAQASLARLYPDFAVADHAAWGKVVTEAKKGNAEALKAVGHTTEATQHPVAAKVLGYVGAGKKGAEVREHFTAAPFGWSRDAVDGVLLTLLAAEHLRASDASGASLNAKNLELGKLGQAAFRQESITISPAQKIVIRRVLGALGLPSQPDQESQSASQVVATLNRLAAAAGGTAPAPEPPNDPIIDDLAGASGNGLLANIHTNAEALTALAANWKQVAEKLKARQPAWETLQRLLRQADDLPDGPALRQEAEAITAARSLLADPDPVGPLRDRVADLLRTALNQRLNDLKAAYEQEQQVLAADATWQSLSEMQRQDLAGKHPVAEPVTPALGSPDDVANALAADSLKQWQTRIDAVPIQFERVRQAAVRLVEPTVQAVSLPRATIKTEAELKTWLADVETLLGQALKEGAVSV